MLNIKAIVFLLCIYIPLLFNIPVNHSFTLKINSINVSENIYSGYSPSLLSKGVVIDPQSLKTNNWVIYGHRFSKSNPLRKYLRDLDKVKKNDVAVVVREGKEYRFLIKEKVVVSPDQLWVISPTQQPTLTIVTCTPISKPVKRLIIISKLVSIK